jgi:hypothetical protein
MRLIRRLTCKLLYHGERTVQPLRRRHLVLVMARRPAVGMIGPTTLTIEMSALGPVGTKPPDKVQITITQPNGEKLTANYVRAYEGERT